MGRTFIDAGAQSTSSGAITAAQTTLTLVSTANFGSPTVILPTSVVILDSGNPAYSAAAPLATPFEYQLITNNVVGTNTLTINNGVRSAYAGTTPKAFFAGATVAAVLLAEDLNLVPQRFATNNASSGTTIVSQTIPSIFRHLDIIYDVGVTLTNTSVFMQLNTDAGAHYYWAHNDAANDGTRAGNGANTSTSAEVGFVGTGGNLDCSGRIRINDIQQTTRHVRWAFECAYDNSSAPIFHSLTGSGLWQAAALAAVTNVTVFISTGAITSSNIDFIGYP